MHSKQFSGLAFKIQALSTKTSEKWILNLKIEIFSLYDIKKKWIPTVSTSLIIVIMFILQSSFFWKTSFSLENRFLGLRRYYTVCHLSFCLHNEIYVYSNVSLIIIDCIFLVIGENETIFVLWLLWANFCIVIDGGRFLFRLYYWMNDMKSHWSFLLYKNAV